MPAPPAEPGVVALVVAVEVVHQPGPVFGLPEHQVPVKLVDERVGIILVNLRSSRPVSEDGQPRGGAVHDESPPAAGHVHRVLGVAAHLHHQPHVVSRLLGHGLTPHLCTGHGEDRTVWQPGTPGVAVVTRLGSIRLDLSVLGVGDFVTTHGKPPSGNSPAPELGLPVFYAQSALFNSA
jgi:hypothetical protein